MYIYEMYKKLLNMLRQIAQFLKQQKWIAKLKSVRRKPRLMQPTLEIKCDVCVCVRVIYVKSIKMHSHTHSRTYMHIYM